MEEIIDTRTFGSSKEGQEGLEKIFQKYEARGFQRWQPPVVLTRFKFTSEAKFVVVEEKTVQQAVEDIVEEANRISGLWWQGETVVEVFEQGQKRVHVFLRNKFGSEALKELADKLDKLQSEKNSGRGVRHVRYIVDDLRKGDLQSAKADCLNQGDKFGNISDIRQILESELFAPDERTPWNLFKEK